MQKFELNKKTGHSLIKISQELCGRTLYKSINWEIIKKQRRLDKGQHTGTKNLNIVGGLIADLKVSIKF